MWQTTEVPNVCIFLLCFGWYILGYRLGKEDERNLRDEN